ncbi:AIM24 family protein [Hazenella sp. IB182357]|uniref:AIM24 family protein n=1 Tax=Polycladospora coralii TaxID=2771432 RepID=A0A926N773_9BACL|nr:AIM24 family protein [Polycladospora coralii]MBD1370807.1 AIM24 family protein [Polycladospora coralii]MBS7529746.1 AIM24 family protein [Polycladospora coralii]
MEKQPFDIIETVPSIYSTFEVLQYKPLELGDFYYSQNSGMRLKQVRIKLNNGAVMIEAGSLHFLKGQISMDNSMGGTKGLINKLTTSMLTNESLFKPVYTGQGEIYLEPSFHHFIPYELNNEEVIVDKGMFYCCDSAIHVGLATQKNISSAVKGGEGLFQTKLSGTGICILKSPVPYQEIVKLELDNERLQVDGNFALLRSGNIQFTVEKSSKSIIGSVTSGEGLLQTFTGTGTVWLAPTQFLYERANRNLQP